MMMSSLTDEKKSTTKETGEDVTMAAGAAGAAARAAPKTSKLPAGASCASRHPNSVRHGHPPLPRRQVCWCRQKHVADATHAAARPDDCCGPLAPPVAARGPNAGR